MGLFDFLDRSAGDSRLSRDLSGLTKTGYGLLDSSKPLTQEGLAGLRSLGSTYQSRLSDPLGPQGRSIFSMAKGALADTGVQRERAFNARIFQLAAQSGGTLSPEAQAQAEAQNQRGINESLISGQRDLATQEASMTLSETSKLFDRMESINKTILGVGQDEQTRALQTIIASLSGRTDRMKAIWGDVVGAFK